MTYHLNGKIVGMRRGLPVQAAAGIGNYLGLDKSDDPLTQTIIDHQGAVDKESMEAYGKVAGQMAAAGACAATGAGAAVSGACAIIGGKIGGLIASSIPYAHGSTGADLVKETVDAMKGQIAASSPGKRAILAYLTARDAAITEVVTAYHVSPEWADQKLQQAGALAAPVLEVWRPTARRWEYFQSAVANVPKNLPSFIQAGFSPEEVTLFTGFAGGPAAPPGAPIDWGLVGDWSAGCAGYSAHITYGQGESKTMTQPIPSQCPVHVAEVLADKLKFARVGLMLAAAKATKKPVDKRVQPADLWEHGVELLHKRRVLAAGILGAGVLAGTLVYWRARR